jgi:hypothetical protein
VVDALGSHHLLYSVEVTFGLCLVERADQGLVRFG